MTEQTVEGLSRADVDTESHRLVRKGAETAAIPSKPVNVFWQLHGQAHFVGGGRKTLAQRLEEAYRDDALTPEEKGLLDDAANQFGSRLSNEE